MYANILKIQLPAEGAVVFCDRKLHQNTAKRSNFHQNLPLQTSTVRICLHAQTTENDVDVDVVDLRAQADASMPASNNNVKLYNISNF